MKIKIILGSTRPNRFSEKVGKWIYEMIKKRGIDIEILDLRDYPLPFFNEPISPAEIKNGSYPNKVARKWASKIREADAFIIVSPEYNHGIPAVLKNALDYIYHEWNKKPVGFVSYGSLGGVRAVEQLRQICIGLEMIPIPKSLHILNHWQLLDEKGNLKKGAFAPLRKKAVAFLEQFVSLAKALKSAKNRLRQRK